jgi:hypothetical protein
MQIVDIYRILVSIALPSNSFLGSSALSHQLGSNSFKVEQDLDYHDFVQSCKCTYYDFRGTGLIEHSRLLYNWLAVSMTEDGRPRKARQLTGLKAKKMTYRLSWPFECHETRS